VNGIRHSLLQFLVEEKRLLAPISCFAEFKMKARNQNTLEIDSTSTLSLNSAKQRQNSTICLDEIVPTIAQEVKIQQNEKLLCCTAGWDCSTGSLHFRFGIKKGQVTPKVDVPFY
jgi:hypothetical protein